MIEQQLQKDIKELFEFKQVTLDAPSESLEQDKLFVEVEQNDTRLKDGLMTGRLRGRIKCYASNDKIPFGYFNKKIQEHKTLSNKFVFFEIDRNNPIFRDKVERSVGFIYFFSGQYDPDLGTLNTLKTYEVNE